MNKTILADIEVWQKTEGVEVVRAISLAEDGTLLDFGAGSGYFTIAALNATKSGQVIAVDREAELLEALKNCATKRGLAQLKTICLHENDSLAIEKESLDVITMNDVIHMIDDKKSLLGQFRMLLKEEGVLAITPFHLTNDDINTLIVEVESYGYRLSHQVEDGGIHFSKVTKMNGAWQRLSDFERETIYCFIKSKN